MRSRSIPPVKLPLSLQQFVSTAQERAMMRNAAANMTTPAADPLMQQQFVSLDQTLQADAENIRNTTNADPLIGMALRL